MFCLLLLCSCGSVPTIYTYSREDNIQLFFFRTSAVKIDLDFSKKLDYDLTVNVKEKTILPYPVLNYMMEVPVNHIADAKSVTVTLGNETIKVRIESKEELFRNPLNRKTVQLRYSVELNNEDFFSLLSNPDNCYIIVESDTSKEFVTSEALTKNMNQLGRAIP